MAGGSAFPASDMEVGDLRGDADGCVQPPLGTCTSPALLCASSGGSSPWKSLQAAQVQFV